MSYLRRENARHRRAVFERDRGICAICNVDCLRLSEWLRSLPLIDGTREWKLGAVRADTQTAFRRVLGRHQHRALVLLGRLWGVRIPSVKTALHQMDHVVPVAEGGGECSLEQLRTLCLRCHAAETKHLAGRLARRPSKGVGRI